MPLRSMDAFGSKKKDYFNMGLEDFKRDLLDKAKHQLEEEMSLADEAHVEEHARRMIFGAEWKSYSLIEAASAHMCNYIGHAYVERLSAAHDIAEEAKSLQIEFNSATGEAKCPRCKEWYTI